MSFLFSLLIFYCRTVRSVRPALPAWMSLLFGMRETNAGTPTGFPVPPCREPPKCPAGGPDAGRIMISYTEDRLSYNGAIGCLGIFEGGIIFVTELQ